MPQGAAAVGLGIHEAPVLVGADQVGSARPAQGGQFAGAAQIARQLIVNLIGGTAGQLRIVQHSQGRWLPDPHLHQPAVDDEVAGGVPQKGIATAPAGSVVKPGVQQLVRQDEQTFSVVQPSGRVDPDRPVAHVDGGHPNVVQPGGWRR